MVVKEAGPYRIVEKIGQGGMGIVYKGIHTKLEQEVAIKVLSPQFSQDPHMRKRFIKEAKIQAKFSHPNVLNILNYLEEDGNVFLIMEYINGETLENRLKREGRLTIEEAVSISLSVLEALDFMHSKGVIHRDIKPSNIMFTDSGIVKVTDFGIAKVIGETVQTGTGTVGTFRYMSPEQILGKETSILSDIYSFGITLYEMVTGRVPFSGDSEYIIMKGHLEEKPLPPLEIKNNVSKELSKIILKALNKDPKDRYQNVKEFAEDLRTAIKKPKRANIIPRKKLNYWSQKIPSLNLDKKGYLTSIGIGIFLLLIILILMWTKPNTISTISDTSALNIDSTQFNLDPGFDTALPENIALEYISTKLEGDIKKQEQQSKVPARKQKRYTQKSMFNRKDAKIYNITSNLDRTNKQQTNEKKEIEEVLRKSFLLPQP